MDHRYFGKISSAKDGYAWIDIASVVKGDGSPHDLQTERDIYLHFTDCSFGLRPGLEVEFVVAADEKRGEGTFRASHARKTNRSALEELTRGGVELHVQGLGNSRVLEQSSVFVSWCLSPNVAAKIMRARLANDVVKLLLVHWPVDGFRERRQLVDLGDPMTSVGFNAPGTHRVVALIVFGGSEDELSDKYLAREDGGYKTTVISHDRCGTVLQEKGACLASGCVEVEVPDGLFAEKPFDWEWVNWLFKTKPRDQCAFRRRRLFAYTLQVPIVLMMGLLLGFIGTLSWLASFFVTVGLFSIGVRGINYTPLRHPLDCKPKEVWDDLKRPVFVPLIKGRHVLLPIVISPPVLIVAGLLTWLISDASFWTLAWFVTFGKVMIVPVVVFAFLTSFVVWHESVDWEKRDRHERQLRREEERRRIAAEVDELVCTTMNPRMPDVWQLPLGPKTVRFYALALKQKVCRGFATS